LLRWSRGCSKQARSADGENQVARRVLIKCERKVHFVKEHEIIFVEAAGNYVHVSLVDDTLLTRSSLNRLGSLLSTERFVRIHRSTIVNLDQICHLEPQSGGEYIVTLNSGKQLKASRRHVCDLMKSIRRSGAGEGPLTDRAATERNTPPRPTLVPRFY
jgi:two-component system LytT family response regulator